MYWFPVNEHERKANEYEKLANELRSKRDAIKTRMDAAEGGINNLKKVKSDEQTNSNKIPGRFFFSANSKTKDSISLIKKDMDTKIKEIKSAIKVADSQRKHYIKLANDDKERERKKLEKELSDIGKNIEKNIKKVF